MCSAIGMPSPYSSQGSIDDSRALAANLGIRFELIGISDLFREYTQRARAAVRRHASRTSPKRTFKSRIRGNLLMALSNKFGSLVLTTGNKSEMAVGYCTLYGDMVGALAVIGDLVKTRVYAICRWLNREREIIPRADPREAAFRRIAARSERYRFAAALRSPRSDPRGLCRAL